tara:strand:- start:7655 stop:7828 length:174 start_codon:yes stop_codon:yes gene_type:complete
MEHRISPGQWIAYLQQIMTSAHDGDCFLLPSYAHLHAYEITKNTAFQQKSFKVRIEL